MRDDRARDDLRSGPALQGHFDRVGMDMECQIEFRGRMVAGAVQERRHRLGHGLGQRLPIGGRAADDLRVLRRHERREDTVPGHRPGRSA